MLPDVGDTSQSLFGLFMWGMIKALPTQDLREYVTAAREKSLSLLFFILYFYFFPFSVPCSPQRSVPLVQQDVIRVLTRHMIARCSPNKHVPEPTCRGQHTRVENASDRETEKEI